MNGFNGFIYNYLFRESARAGVSLFLGMIFNLLYAAFNVSLGIIYKDAHFIAVGVFYFVMIAMRFIPLDSDLENTDGAEGVLLLVLSFPMCGLIMRTVYLDKATRHAGITLLFLALYAIIGGALAVVRFIRYLKNGRRIENYSYTVPLASTLLAAFNLQVALIEKSGLDSQTKMTLNFITGAFVSLLIFLLGIRAIIRSKRVKNK